MAAERLAGWIKGFGMLAGIGAIPLLAELPWPGAGYWAASLAAGLLVLGAGLYTLARASRLGRGASRPADPDQVLADEQFLGRSLRVTAPRKPPAVDSAGEIPTSASEPQASAAAEDALRQASLLAILGIFILLPAIAGFLLQVAAVADGQRAAAYLGGPALALWAAFEGKAFYARWRERASGRESILGLASHGAQILAALLVWIFLGLAYSYPLASVIWLFWAGASLALLGALAGALADRRTPPEGREPLSDAAGRAAPAEELARSGLKERPQDDKSATLRKPSRKPTPPAEAPTAQETAGSWEPAPQSELPGTDGQPAAGEGAPPRARRAVFRVFRGVDGQFYFRLRAANGEVVLRSEGYRAKTGCLKGVQSVRENAALAGRYERCETRDGQFYFILKAANHQVIGASEMYTTLAGREAGIQAVLRAAPRAGVEEVE